MKINEIIEVVRNLAQSQGLYGRILAHWNEVAENDPDEWNYIVEQLEAQNFKDAVDFVMFVEC